MKTKKDEKIQQISFLDERYYEVNKGVYYPSVTYVLDNGFPKGKAFAQWLKDVGNNAKYVSERAMEKGSIVHDACERLSLGNEIHWDDSIYDLTMWLALLGYSQFYKKYVNKVIATEIKVYSDAYKYAGTVDFICEIDGEIWLIDYKFGNAIYETYFLQLAAYVRAWNEMKGNYKINRYGVLHLKAKTRTEINGKIQGKGWQLKESPNTLEQDIKIFDSALNIHNFLEPVPKPKNREYPAVLQLDIKM